MHGLLLAAGAAQRMGAPKLLLPAPEGTILRRMALLLRATVPGRVVVVLGGEAFLHRRALEGVRGIRTVLNPAYREGLATSLKRGLKALPPGPVLVVPADQAGLEAAHLRTLLAAFREPGVLAAKGGEAMSPAILGARARAQAEALSGDRGAKGLLLALGAGTVELGPGLWDLDLDTWPAYRAWAEALGFCPEGLPLPERPPYPALLRRPLWTLGPARLALGRPGRYSTPEGLVLAEGEALRLLARGAATLMALGL